MTATRKLWSGATHSSTGWRITRLSAARRAIRPSSTRDRAESSRTTTRRTSASISGTRRVCTIIGTSSLPESYSTSWNTTLTITRVGQSIRSRNPTGGRRRGWMSERRWCHLGWKTSNCRISISNRRPRNGWRIRSSIKHWNVIKSFKIEYFCR